jgi:hypothetical protein
VWLLPLLFPFFFPTLLADVTLKEGGCGQRGGNRERPMVFHDEVASYLIVVGLDTRMIADPGRDRRVQNGKESTSIMHYIH